VKQVWIQWRNLPKEIRTIFLKKSLRLILRKTCKAITFTLNGKRLDRAVQAKKLKKVFMGINKEKNVF
jgi:hypothetical protein